MTFITSSGGTAFRREPQVSIRPWLFSIVSTRLGLGGADHTAEGERGRKGLFDIRFQAGLVALDGEEVVPAAVDDRLTDRPLGENRVARDGDTFERQRFQQLQRGGDFIRPRFPLRPVRRRIGVAIGSRCYPKKSQGGLTELLSLSVPWAGPAEMGLRDQPTRDQTRRKRQTNGGLGGERHNFSDARTEDAFPNRGDSWKPA